MTSRSVRSYLAAGGWEPGDCGRAYAQMGLLGLPFAEENGGARRRPRVESLIVMEAFRAPPFALEPYLATVVLAGGCLRYAGSEVLRCTGPFRRSSKGLSCSRLRIPNGRHAMDLSAVDNQGPAFTADGWLIDGAKTLRLAGGFRGSPDYPRLALVAIAGIPDGIALFLVDATAPGLQAPAATSHRDGSRAADVQFLEGFAYPRMP